MTGCQSPVEADSPSTIYCKGCIAKIELQRARGALRAKLPSILAG